MKSLWWVLLLWASVLCDAQMPCDPATLTDAADRVHRIQDELKCIQVRELDTVVPDTARDYLTQLKDALSCVADAALSQAGSSIEAGELRNKIADLLRASRPEPADNSDVSRDDLALGSYAGNLTVDVIRPSNTAPLLLVGFSVNIPCGDDHMLLVYELRDGLWSKQMRWQAPPLKQISDAFGDFFLSATLPAPAGGDSPTLVVAHGHPWCTSRFSGFSVDVLAQGSTPDLPKVVWNTKRSYSRGDFSPTLTSSGGTFELRVNETTMDVKAFERRVIYRYRFDERLGVRRIEPIALNARGFVEEWLSAPWSESEAFSEQGATSSLHAIHNQFERPAESQTEFVTHSYGPVRACHAAGIFQVEIGSTLKKSVPGKPGGESQRLPVHYFHVREIKDGYLMLSAPTEPDPTCRGANLMLSTAN